MHTAEWAGLILAAANAAVWVCRASTFARNNEAQVKKLKRIVQLEVGAAFAAGLC